ncbi:general substrate transporter [Corynespora cassiicola Philippines]|uniref:General substrate transporter n=1 Tax=Corynespora cassiicola Philippines TaxID=1448308 RepID=A0A2T2PD33_CORCC|nr:general substrate transporter [Corynespora cassiicola Philippines]
MAIPPKLYQFLVGVFASLGSFSYGYDLGVIGGSVASPSFGSYFNDPNPDQVGAVVSLFTGGGFFGAFLAGPSADLLGRRIAIIIGSLVFILGGILQAVAQNISFLYSGRAIAGFGVGYLVMIVPLYQAEIAHPSIRGRITALQQLMLGIGAVVATWLTHGTNVEISDTDNNQWRIPLGIQVVPSGILASMILLFPESPRWLIDHDRKEEGLKTLARLHSNGDLNDPWVQEEYHQIEHAISVEHEQAAKGYKDLFTDKSSFRRLFLVMAIQASVQMTGVSAIQYYTPEIYSTLNIGVSDSLKYQGISNVISVVAQACTVAFIDRIGRRWPLIIGNAINGVCWIIVVIAIALFPDAPPSRQNSLGWTFICINWVYQASFSFTCGPLSWIIPAEVFDTKTRSKGVSIGVMTSFAFNTLVGQVTPVAMSSVGWRYFLTFVICNFTNAVFFWATQPETAKRPLEEMNILFSGNVWFVAGGRGRLPHSNTGVLGFDKDIEDKEMTTQTRHVE